MLEIAPLINLRCVYLQSDWVCLALSFIWGPSWSPAQALNILSVEA